VENWGHSDLLSGAGLLEQSTKSRTCVCIIPPETSDFRRSALMLTIRPATRSDTQILRTLIHELAEFERLQDEAIITEEDVLRDAFGSRTKFRALIAEWDSAVAGYAVF